MSGLLPIECALEAMMEVVSPILGRETKGLYESPGRVLAEPYYARINTPPADNSAMDGYALAHSNAGEVLEISQRIPAGASPEPLIRGTAARIFTGAVVPPGADVVVMQEDCEERDGFVKVPADLIQGDNIRLRGSDVPEGSLLFNAGTVLTPPALALMASQGFHRLTCYRRPKVGLLQSGDELYEPGTEPLPQGGIYNSNRSLLEALVAQCGAEVIGVWHVKDDLESTCDALLEAVAQSDVVITTGGVSVGDEDHIKPAIERLGSLDLWRLALKPGKPFAFGSIGGVPILGLPGNPSSVLVTFSILVRPVLFRLCGAQSAELPTFWVRSAFDFTGGLRAEFLRGQITSREQQTYAHVLRNQSSGALRAASESDVLIKIPVGASISEGDPIEVIPLKALF
jgi:molybdopterin molybdotransferase